MVALLEALEKFGDARALPAVQKLATAFVLLPNGKRVQAAARACLPRLRERIQAQETSSTLLRASSAGESSGETLLRPAHGGNTTAPDELLRPARPDSEAL